MANKAKNRIITVVALFFIATAAFLTIKLMTDESFLAGDPLDELEKEAVAEEHTTVSTTEYDGLVPIVNAKYLWEYGWQTIASGSPEKITEAPSVLIPVVTTQTPTVVAVVTDWRGEAVTDENGKPVTEVHTAPPTVKHVEYITDANGERVTGSDGKPVTEVRTEVVTTAAPPVTVTDAHGKVVTNADGSIVTEATTVARTTAVVVGSTAAGAKHWASGVTNGETYVSMKIYIDGDYEITSRSVMTLTLRESSGLVAIPNTLTYNLSKGTCTISPTKKVEQMAYVSHSGGKTIVTLMIPESSQPLAKNTTSFKASSTLSTFSDSDGNNLDAFTVSVL